MHFCWLYICLQMNKRSLQRFVWRVSAFHMHKESLLFVEVDERPGAPFIGFHANANGLGLVVFPLEQISTTMVANTFLFWGKSLDMEDRLAFETGATASQPGNYSLNRQFVGDHRIQLDFLVFQHHVKSFGLGDCTRESIKQESTSAIDATCPFADQSDNEAVPDKGTLFHKLQGFLHRRRSVAGFQRFCSAEDIAGGQVAGTKVLGQ